MTGDKRKPLIFEPEPERAPEPTNAATEQPRAETKKPEAFAPPPPPPEAQLPAVAVIETLADDAGRGIGWGKIFAGATAGLVSLAAGVWFWSLIETLFQRIPLLGWVAAGLGGVAAVAALAIIVRNMASYRRLREITSLREAIEEAGDTITLRAAHAIGDDVISLFKGRADMARAKRMLVGHRADIMDGSDYLAIVETSTLSPLDARASKLIADTVKRVSVVTAISPRAFLDVAFVLYENARLISRIAALYGGRPSKLAFLPLVRRTVEHLAVTGAVAVGDSVLQQALGHGLAAKLSARLGEGVLNGFLTARIGLAAMDVSRPMPFKAVERPRFSQLMADVSRFGTSADDTTKKAD